MRKADHLEAHTALERVGHLSRKTTHSNARYLHQTLPTTAPHRVLGTLLGDHIGDHTGDLIITYGRPCKFCFATLCSKIGFRRQQLVEGGSRQLHLYDQGGSFVRAW